MKVCDLGLPSSHFLEPQPLATTIPVSVSLSLAVLKIDSTCNWDHAVFRVPPLTELYSRKHNRVFRNPFVCIYLAPYHLLPPGNVNRWLRKNVYLYSEPLSRFHITLQSAGWFLTPLPSEQVWSPLSYFMLILSNNILNKFRPIW